MATTVEGADTIFFLQGDLIWIGQTGHLSKLIGADRFNID
jgi:hypothetical protein